MASDLNPFISQSSLNKILLYSVIYNNPGQSIKTLSDQLHLNYQSTYHLYNELKKEVPSLFDHMLDNQLVPSPITISQKEFQQSKFYQALLLTNLHVTPNSSDERVLLNKPSYYRVKQLNKFTQQIGIHFNVNKKADGTLVNKANFFYQLLSLTGQLNLVDQITNVDLVDKLIGSLAIEPTAKQKSWLGLISHFITTDTLLHQNYLPLNPPTPRFALEKLEPFFQNTSLSSMTKFLQTLWLRIQLENSSSQKTTVFKQIISYVFGQNFNELHHRLISQTGIQLTKSQLTILTTELMHRVLFGAYSNLTFNKTSSHPSKQDKVIAKFLIDQLVLPLYTTFTSKFIDELSTFTQFVSINHTEQSNIHVNINLPAKIAMKIKMQIPPKFKLQTNILKNNDQPIITIDSLERSNTDTFYWNVLLPFEFNLNCLKVWLEKL